MLTYTTALERSDYPRCPPAPQEKKLRFSRVADIVASFCLSTYSGNFLLNDQFLTFEAHSSLFSVFAHLL